MKLIKVHSSDNGHHWINPAHFQQIIITDEILMAIMPDGKELQYKLTKEKSELILNQLRAMEALHKH